MGTAHCGSTLLTMILGSHSDCLALGEVSNMPEAYRLKKPICSVCQGDCSFWERSFTEQERSLLSKGFSERRLHRYIPLKLEKTVRGFLKNDQVFNPYSLIASKTNKKVLIDSTKTVYWLNKKLAAREFQDNLLDARLIHLIRDGRAVMNSYLRRKQAQGMTVQKFGEMWAKRINNENNFFDSFSGGKKIQLRYEKFATEVEETLKSLCDWLDIDFQPEMVNYWQHQHHAISGNSGTRSLIRKYQNSESMQSGSDTQRPANRYEERDFCIQLDQRWRTKLSAEQVAEFYKVTGGLNKAYEWN
ncbi:MAG: sulfotransferase [Phormidesmis sp.]